MNFKDFEWMHFLANKATICAYGTERQIDSFNSLCDVVEAAGMVDELEEENYKATDIEIVQWIMQRADLILARQPR